MNAKTEILQKFVRENLRNWFKKEKWKRIDTQGNIKGDCGTMPKGKKTQRCLPAAKARSLTKKQRAATSRKKTRSNKQFVSNTKKAKVKLKEMDKAKLLELKQLFEKLCAKGKAYAARRKAAGEKHGAYLMGRAVKVCKGQIKGEDINEADIEELNIFGYQTKHFDMCPGARRLYQDILDGKHDEAISNSNIGQRFGMESAKNNFIKEMAQRQDLIFDLEKRALGKDRGSGGADQKMVDVAKSSAVETMKVAKMVGLEKEHDYVQGHVDTIEDIAQNKTEPYRMGFRLKPEFQNKDNRVREDIKTKDNTEFNLSLKHLLKKHVTKGGEIDEIDMSINEVFNLEIDESITEAKYKGKTVKLNSPMRGDSKKFKVYVANGKNKDGSIKVKKVNFGHGGTSAKKRGEKTLKIRKSNPKARAAFRARHRCDNPGPKTMARYWSCRKW